MKEYQINSVQVLSSNTDDNQPDDPLTWREVIAIVNVELPISDLDNSSHQRSMFGMQEPLFHS